MVNEPAAQFAEGQTMSHGNGTCADKAFPTRSQGEALDRPARGVRAIQNPNGLSGFCRFLQNVKERGDEGINPAAKVLKVD